MLGPSNKHVAFHAFAFASIQTTSAITRHHLRYWPTLVQTLLVPPQRVYEALMSSKERPIGR